MAHLLRRLVPGAIVGALVVGGMVAAAPAALAGDSAQGGVHGLIGVAPPAVHLACDADAPSGMGVTFDWDSTLYRAKKAALRVVLTLQHTGFDERVTSSTSITIKKGKKGTATASFTVPASAVGFDSFVEIMLRDDVLAQASMPIDCAAPVLAPVAPKVTITKVTCDYKLSIAIDARKSPQSWQATTFWGFDGFGYVPNTFKAGKKKTFTFQVPAVDWTFYNPLGFIVKVSIDPPRHDGDAAALANGQIVMPLSRPRSCGPDVAVPKAYRVTATVTKTATAKAKASAEIPGQPGEKVHVTATAKAKATYSYTSVAETKAAAKASARTMASEWAKSLAREKAKAKATKKAEKLAAQQALHAAGTGYTVRIPS